MYFNEVALVLIKKQQQEEPQQQQQQQQFGTGSYDDGNVKH